MKRAKKRYTLDRRLLRLAELASENEEESFGALESVAFVPVLLPHAALAPLPLSSRRRVILGFLLSRRRIENCKSTPWIMFLLLRFLFLLLLLLRLGAEKNQLFDSRQWKLGWMEKSKETS